MSVKVMGQVWELADLTPAEQHVLLAYADHADHDGRNVRPRPELIAWKTGYSESQVDRVRASLVRKGLMVRVGTTKGGRGHTQEFEIHCENGSKKLPFNAVVTDSKNCNKNGSKMHQFKANETGASCSPLDAETAASCAGLSVGKGSNGDPDRGANDGINGSNGQGDYRGSLRSSAPDPSKEEPSEEEPSTKNPPQPPIGGSECVGRSGVPLPKHLPEEARRIYKRYPVKEDPDAFRRAWDRRHPDAEAIAKIDALLDAFDGRTLTVEEKTHIPGPAVFVNQQRWTWDVPFKGLSIYEVSQRPKERPKTIEEQRAAQAEEDRQRAEQRTHERMAVEKQAELGEDARVDAEIVALPDFEREEIERLALARFEVRLPGKDPTTAPNRRLIATFARDIYARQQNEKAGAQ